VDNLPIFGKFKPQKTQKPSRAKTCFLTGLVFTNERMRGGRDQTRMSQAISLILWCALVGWFT